MKVVRVIAGVTLLVLALVLGVYVGLVLMFIRGIAQFVDAVQRDPVDGGLVAWAVVKVLFAAPAGQLVAFIVGAAGLACFKDG